MKYIELIKSNSFFWKSVNSKKNENSLLYTSFFSENAMAYGIIKTALTIAYLKNVKPIGIMSFNQTKDDVGFHYSMNSIIVGNKLAVILCFFKHLFLKALFVCAHCRAG